MNTGATYMGWDFDEAMTRHADLEDGKRYLEKAIESLKEAEFSYATLEEIVKEVKREMTNMNFIAAKCRKQEDDANYRLGGDL